MDMTSLPQDDEQRLALDRKRTYAPVVGDVLDLLGRQTYGVL